MTDLETNLTHQILQQLQHRLSNCIHNNSTHIHQQPSKLISKPNTNKSTYNQFPTNIFRPPNISSIKNNHTIQTQPNHTLQTQPNHKTQIHFDSLNKINTFTNHLQQSIDQTADKHESIQSHQYILNYLKQQVQISNYNLTKISNDNQNLKLLNIELQSKLDCQYDQIRSKYKQKLKKTKQMIKQKHHYQLQQMLSQLSAIKKQKDELLRQYLGFKRQYNSYQIRCRSASQRKQKAEQSYQQRILRSSKNKQDLLDYMNTNDVQLCFKKEIQKIKRNNQYKMIQIKRQIDSKNDIY